MSLRAQLEKRLGPAYRIERELGGGGMSHVFLAEEVALGRRVVVKVLPPDAVAGVDAERFRREIQLAASLQHPHVVPLLHADASGDLLYYTMPYVEGETLRARLAREHELPVDVAVRIWRELLDALSYAHGRGVVHRDIKPENILSSGRHCVVTDFGVAKALSAATGSGAMTGVGLALGTPAYMSPEQATADPSVDHRADLYAAGLVMYEMLAGRAPFEGLNASQLMAAHAARAPAPVQESRPAVPAPLAALVMRCLEKRPADRPQSADEVLATLDVITTPGSTIATQAQPANRPTAIRRTRVLFAVAVIAAVAIAGFFATRDRAPARIGADPNDSTVRSIGVVGFTAEAGDSVAAREGTELVRRHILESVRLFTLTGANVAQFERWAFDLADGERAHPDSLASALTRVGVHVVLRGRISRLGTSFVVTVEMTPIAPGTPPLETITETAADAASLARVLDRIAERTVASLERAAPTMKAPPVFGLATSSSLEALRLYQEATDIAFGANADMGASIQRLREAVTVDPTFAPGWRRLSGNLGNAQLRRAEAVSAATRAFEERDHVRSWERSMIEGTYHQRFEREEESIAALAPSVNRGVRDAIHNTGVLYSITGRPEIAIRYFERNHADDRSYGNGPLQYATALLIMGRVAEAESLYTWGQRVSPGNGFVGETSMRLRIARRDYTGIRAVLDQAPALEHAPAASSARMAIGSRLRATAAVEGRLSEMRRQGELMATVALAFNSPADALRERLYDVATEASAGLEPGPLTGRLRELLRANPYRDFETLDRPYQAEFTAWSTLGNTAEAARVLAAWDSDLTGELSTLDDVPRAIARGDLAMARGDGVAALKEYGIVRRTGCPTCALPRIARAYASRRMADSAIAAYEGYLASTNPYQEIFDQFELAATYRRLGELYEEKGDLPRAIQRYEGFVELWKAADPELLPQVERVRAKIAELRRRTG